MSIPASSQEGAPTIEADRRPSAIKNAQSTPKQRIADRIEFAATLLMAVAAILTAWAAFQSTKWSGVQADNYSRAGTARIESARSTTLASRQITIDVSTFLQWLEAFRDDLEAGRISQPTPGQAYVADPMLLSGFIASRFREEFRPAFDAWYTSRPLANPDAPGTPFEMPEYTIAPEAESVRLAEEAEQRSAEARAANQRGDNYVLLTVLFAIALFFAGVSGKLDRVTNSAIAFGISVVIVAVAAILMGTYPVEI